MEKPRSCCLSLMESISQREQQACDAKRVSLQRIPLTSVMSSSLSEVSWNVLLQTPKMVEQSSQRPELRQSHTFLRRYMASAPQWRQLMHGCINMLQRAELESLFTMKSSGSSWPPVSMLTEAFILALSAQLCTADPLLTHLASICIHLKKSDSSPLDLNVPSLSSKPSRTAESIF